MNTPILSILTPSIPSRTLEVAELTGRLADQISKVYPSSAIEHLILTDNLRRTIGAKRQALMSIARGKYIAYIDDDDDVSDDYVVSILKATATGADCITFDQWVNQDGQFSTVSFGVKNIDESFNRAGGVTLRAPSISCVWKRDVVADCVFAENIDAESLTWCLQARQRIKTGHHIDRILATRTNLARIVP